MCGFIAQLVEHHTGIAEITGSNPVEALTFSRLLLSICLNWKIYSDDHSSLSYFDNVMTKFMIINRTDAEGRRDKIKNSCVCLFIDIEN